MRAELAKREGLRGTFTATFSKPGSRTRGGYFQPMLLFVNVCDSHGVEVTDHLWFDVAKCWEALKLKPGDRVEFTARVREYWKGYHDNRRRDFRLSFPRAVRVIDRPTAPRDTAGQLTFF